MENSWKACSTCKKPIALGSQYFVCSVSTCNGQRTGYVFCSMQCFETHLPGARHRDAGAIRMTAPSKIETTQEQTRAPARIIVKTPGHGSQSTTSANSKSTGEVLIIASRLKEYIQATADFNTSAAVMDVLSDHVRNICDQAVLHARSEGRKTVLDRDLEFLKRIRF